MEFRDNAAEPELPASDPKTGGMEEGISGRELEVPSGTDQASDSRGDLTIFVCKGFSGEISRVVVDSTQVPFQAIPDIADQIGYFTTDWEKIGLYNLTRDFEYDLLQPFSETRTEQGDMVVMADGAACHK